MNPRNIQISDYTYTLPNERIALHPLPDRAASKLLTWKQGAMQETTFREIASWLPANSKLVFNNTRVINARIRFTKSTGGQVEIFCLEPAGSMKDYATVLSSTGHTAWKCFIGGVAKWKEQFLTMICHINGKEVTVKAERREKIDEAWIVEFSWEPANLSWAEILQAAGQIPLPPYIKRSPEEEDLERYQTVFATEPGSVAAPTAGLHFTDEILKEIKEKGVSQTAVTLQVGAGTFKPVTAETMSGHNMHAEWIDVSRKAIAELATHTGDIVAVGTTSLRTLETLYWLGIQTMLEPGIASLHLGQWDVYENNWPQNTGRKEALEALVNWMEGRGMQNVFTQTQLLIVPGYSFRVVDILITNFHQPQSTLLLIVAAAMGNSWKKMYDYALANDFRFLSYGDASLLFIQKDQG